MLKYFDEQLEKFNPLTEDDVIELANRRIEKTPEKRDEILTYWNSRVGKYMLYYMIDEGDTLRMEYSFDDDLEKCDNFEYVRSSLSFPVFRKLGE